LCLCPLIDAYSSICQITASSRIQKEENKAKDTWDLELFHINVVAHVSGVFCVSRSYWFFFGRFAKDTLKFRIKNFSLFKKRIKNLSMKYLLIM